LSASSNTSIFTRVKEKKQKMWLLKEEGRTGSGETSLWQLMLVGETELCWERTREEDEFHTRGCLLIT